MNGFPAWYFDKSKMADVDFEDVVLEAYDCNQTSSTPEKKQALVTRLAFVKG